MWAEPVENGIARTRAWRSLKCRRTRGISVCCGRALGLTGTSALQCVHMVAHSMTSSAPELDMDSTMAGPTESRGGGFENKLILSRG